MKPLAWGIAIPLLAVAIASRAALHEHVAQGPAQNGAAVAAVSRPCSGVPTSAKPSKGASKNKRHKPGDEEADAAGACLEVHSSAVEVQEYLQAQGREEKWTLTEERVAENAWTFSRRLEKDELLRYTKHDASTDGVDWTSGEAFIQVKTQELEEGFVRVQVAARFKGYGQSSDRFAPPKDSWVLNSNTALENQIIAMLEKHFKNAT